MTNSSLRAIEASLWIPYDCESRGSYFPDLSKTLGQAQLSCLDNHLPIILVHYHWTSSRRDLLDPPETPTPYAHKMVRETIASKIALTLIPPFRGLKNGTEDPYEYLKELELEGERNFPDCLAAFEDDVLRILFSENLQDEAYDWYENDLSSEVKQDWSRLKAAFLSEYQIITADEPPPRRLELLREIVELKQGGRENIVGYLKRAAELARKVAIVEVHAAMTQADVVVLRITAGTGNTIVMQDGSIRHMKTERERGLDVSFLSADRLVKAAYREIEALPDTEYGPVKKEKLRKDVEKELRPLLEAKFDVTWKGKIRTGLQTEWKERVQAILHQSRKALEGE